MGAKLSGHHCVCEKRIKCFSTRSSSSSVRSPPADDFAVIDIHPGQQPKYIGEFLTKFLKKTGKIVKFDHFCENLCIFRVYGFYGRLRGKFGKDF